ncbi:hypothetical protein [Urechidicola croceus]|uniref:Uncharacterized protein n=1 Tax=Urechidicola croceus TaxID=1850246 RepID=A0A1D8P7F6_9FLAO|nr:hypothetical protein [Urechidicola croceus]AOW20510.1 hypothetical protein LPB138_07400 [Urechidicola croceus]
MNIHTNYRIYPKAIKEFIEDNYELKSINFGNIQNNLIAVLEKLKLDEILDCKWEINPLHFLDKVDISKENNKLSDFDQYSNFLFLVILKDGKSKADFQKAIKTFDSEFIQKYQNKALSEYQEIKSQELIKAKKQERLLYYAAGILFIIMASTIVILKVMND